MITSVSATDLNETNNINDVNHISSNVEVVNSNHSSMSNHVLSGGENDKLEDTNYKSLSDLSTLIKVTPNSLVLDDDFQYVDSPLKINKNNFVLDFNNHILNANGFSGNVLEITGKNVTIKNMQFINGKGTSISSSMTWAKHKYTRYWADVYPIIWSGDNGVLNNCKLYNCEIALKWSGNNGLITNSRFFNSKYEQVYSEGQNFKIKNTNFTNITGFSGSSYTNGHVGNIVETKYSSKISYCNIEGFSNGLVVYGDVEYCNFTGIRSPLKIYYGLISHCIFDGCLCAKHAYEENYFNEPIISITSSKMEYSTMMNCKSNIYPQGNYRNNIIAISLDVTSSIINCDFINNTVGGLFQCSPQNGIENCNFYNNTIKSYLFAKISSGTTTLNTFLNSYLESCTFINNKFDFNYIINTDGVVRVYNSKFINNTLINHFKVNSGKLMISNSTFITNQTETDGWAILLKDSSMHFIIDDETFFNNKTHRAINLNTWDTSSFTHVYINQTGGGTGLSKDDPTSWNLAISSIDSYGIIEFVNNGLDYSFSSILVVNKPISILGGGVTIIGGSHAIFRIASNNVCIENFTLRDSTSSDAAILATNMDSFARYQLKVINCTFINNVGRDSGAISTKGSSKFFTGRDLYVDNCKFFGNSASGSVSVSSDGGDAAETTQNAGAISVWGGAYIYNSIFDSNHASYCGALAFTYFYGVVENCTFTNNYATTQFNVNNIGQGGFQTAGALVMHVVDNAKSYVSGCIFENNTSPLAGALYIQGSDKNLRNVVARGHVNVSNSVFINNNATTRGSALYLFSDDAWVDNCTFINNKQLDTGNGRGGTIFLDGSSLNLLNSVFTNNSAAQEGSAIRPHNDLAGNLNILYCNFTGNIKSTIALNLQNAYIKGCNFISNVDGCIVAFRKISNQNLNIIDSVFNKNEYINGSAVYSIIPTFISKSTFSENSASGFGGAVYIVHPEAIVEYSNFTNNIAQNAAGAIFIGGEDTIIDHCRFIGNFANSTTLGGGAIYDNANNTIVMASYFTNNNATNLGGAIYVIDDIAYSVDVMTKSTFRHNTCLNHTGEPHNKNWNNIYDGTAVELLFYVYVVLHPESWMGNDGIVSADTGETWENATSFELGFSKLAPKGTMIFVNNSEVFDFTTPGSLNSLVFNKLGIKLIGNNTTILGLNFKINSRATSVSFYNFIFKGNNDSAIMWDSTGGLIDNCTFIGNGGNLCYKGGAIQILKDNITILNSKFINNEVSYENIEINEGGGALYFNASDIFIDNCTFDLNSANNGAHIYLSENSNNVIISNSNFFNGFGIDMYGHAIKIDSVENVQIINCIFANNTLRDTGYYDGGAIIVGGDILYIAIKNSNFINNTASSSGGAIAFIGNCILGIVENNTFINNRVSGFTDINTHIYYPAHYGGAVYVERGDVSFKNNNFTQNNANLGGAIFNKVLITVRGDLFVENNASNGGAIYSNATLSCYNSIFIKNNASNYGGAIYSNVQVNLHFNNFSSNKAFHGGALYLNADNNDLNNLYFTNNTANHGSPIYVGINKKITVNNVILEENNVTGTHEHDGNIGPCGDIHITDDNSINIIGNSLKLGTMEKPETICIGDVYWSDYLYVSNNGGNTGLLYENPISLKEALNHIRSGGKLIFIDKEYELNDLVIKNLNNITFMGNGTVFKRNDSNVSNKGLLNFTNSSINLENIDFEIDLNINAGSEIKITNSQIKSNITTENSAKLDMENIIVSTPGITIKYGIGSLGSIENSTFTNIVNTNSPILDISGEVNISDMEFSNNIGTSIVYNDGSKGIIANANFTNNIESNNIIANNGNLIINNSKIWANNITNSAIYYGPAASGSVINCEFTNNNASDGVRNINITDINNVVVLNNTFDAILKDVKISSNVYGEDIIVNGTFDAGVNFKIDGITLTFNNTALTNQTTTINSNASFSFNVNGGVLAVGNYNITADDLKAYNKYDIAHINNEVNVIKAVVAALNIDEIHIIYGMNNTITLTGIFNQTGTRINYTGVVKVNITNINGCIYNLTANVVDGVLSTILIDNGVLSAGKYDVIISNNGNSDNENYTVVSNIFTNNLTVIKANVTVYQVNNITITYGMNDSVIVHGKVSNSTYGVLYNGLINITINNSVIGCNISAINVLVNDGEFNVNIVDKGNLSAGIYDIDIDSNYLNANYTFTSVKFRNNVTVIKANVTVFDLVNVTVIYGMNKTINITGKVSNSTYGVLYNGLINITIIDSSTGCNVSMTNIVVRNGEFNNAVADFGKLSAGIYDVNIDSNYLNANYTFTQKSFTNNIIINKYNVTADIIKINITYGADKVVVIGNISNSTYGVYYNGYVDITIGNHSYNNIQVINGKFNITINDLSSYNVGVYNVSVSQTTINANYTLNNVTFKDYFIINKASSNIHVSNITVKYTGVIILPITCINITEINARVYALNGSSVSGVTISVDSLNSIRIDGLPVGDYVLNITGKSDNNHYGYNASCNISVIKSSSSLIVDNVSIIYGSGNVTIWYDVVNATVDSFKIYDMDNNPVNCKITKFKYTFEISGLAVGEYKFVVNADGGVNYENSSSISNITIIPAGSKVVVPVIVITYGEHAILNVSGENITGISTISILDGDGHIVGDYSIDGFVIDVWNLNSSSASYKINVTANVDENHTASNGIGLIFVKKAGSAIHVPDNFNITYGSIKNITIALENVTVEDIIGVYVVSNGEVVSCNIYRDGRNISIGVLPVGDYAIIVESMETTNFNASVGAGNFKVIKAGSSVKIPTLSNLTHLGGVINATDLVNASGISVKVFDEFGNQIRVNVDGLKIILGKIVPGLYSLNVTTIVDSNHAPYSVVGLLDVEKILSPSSTIITNVTNGIFNTSDVTIEFNVVNRTVVSVVVFINGTNICIFNDTDFKGNIFNKSDLDPGIYNITIFNSEDDYYNSSSASVLFEIIKASSSINITNINNGVVNISNASVCFDVFNKTSISIILTNSSGDVILAYDNYDGNILSIAGLPLGSYNFTIINHENSYYNAFNISGTFKVVVDKTIFASDLSRGYNSPYDYIAIFTDEYGNKLNNTNVTMIVDNITYTVITNNEGVAYLNKTSLAVGVHEVNIINPITGEKVKYNATIVERLQENKNIVMDFHDGTYYVVRAYGDDAQPIAGVYVSITINGITYDVKTDEEGYALLRIRLNPSSYKIGAEWKVNKTNKIVVKQTLKAKSVTAKKSKNLKFTATLKWSNGKAIVGKKIVFKFKGKKYVAKTNKKGIATITIKKSAFKNLKVGKKYKISITYNSKDKGYTAVNCIIKTIKIKK